MAVIYLVCLSFVLAVCNAFFFVPDDVDRVHTNVGDIIGTTTTVTVNGGRFQVRNFLGIPYAEAPVGDRRFRKPVPKAPFATPFNATVTGPNCFQVSNTPSNPVSEDCLVLNIYVPSRNTLSTAAGNYPVMIWIHGGGFIMGSSNTYVSDTLSAFGNVIVVTINYRLAAHGFLSTGDTNAPGNYGLWDQHLAIKWVHDNIQAFGGNRNSVTIFGESAGSSSVIYQAVYPGNRGLIHRAIAESGSITSYWASSQNVLKDSAMKYASLTGCKHDDPAAMMTCLRSKTSQELLDIQISDLSSFTDDFPWKPSVDGDFVIEHPWKILNGGRSSESFRKTLQSLDLIIGANSFDGALITALVAYAYNQTVNDFAPTPQQFRAMVSDFFTHMKQVDIPSALQSATVFEYTTWSDVDNAKATLTNFINMVTDDSMYVPAVQTLNAHHGNRSAFLYKFATRPTAGHPLPLPDWLDSPTVANHADDLLYVFGFDANFLAQFNTTLPVAGPASAQDMRLAYAMMTMWTNFAKSGNPNSPVDVKKYINTTWPQYDPTTEKYLEITPTMGPGSVKEKLAPKAVEFWGKLVPAIQQEVDLRKQNGACQTN